MLIKVFNLSRIMLAVSLTETYSLAPLGYFVEMAEKFIPSRAQIICLVNKSDLACATKKLRNYILDFNESIKFYSS